MRTWAVIGGSGGGGAGGATTVNLTPASATFPDGTASNLAPQLARIKSSAAAPTPYFFQLSFDAGQTEQAMWQFVVPSNFASAPVLNVQYKMASATSGDIRLDARVGAVTPGDATDLDAKAFAAANLLTDTVPGTAGHVKEAAIPLANADALDAGDLAIVYLARLGGDGADTAAGDCEVVSVVLSYTAT
jgi:hypothetical protein